jgi:hypothetical protein
MFSILLVLLKVLKMMIICLSHPQAEVTKYSPSSFLGTSYKSIKIRRDLHPMCPDSSLQAGSVLAFHETHSGHNGLWHECIQEEPEGTPNMSFNIACCISVHYYKQSKRGENLCDKVIKNPRSECYCNYFS